MNTNIIITLLLIVLGATVYLYTVRSPEQPAPAAPATVVAEEEDEATPASNEPDIDASALDLSGQGLTAVPMDVFTRTDLTKLDLSDNMLTGALPAEVRHLSKLQRLDLSHNSFTGVPAEVGQLSELLYLDLSYNQLTGLPYELGNLKKLEVLDLTGNEYAQQDLAIIRQGLPADVRILGER